MQFWNSSEKSPRATKVVSSSQLPERFAAISDAMNFDSVNLSLAASYFEIYHASLCESISLAAEGFYANQYFSLLKDSIMHLSLLTKRLYSKTLLLDSRQLTSPRERMHLLEYLNDGK